MKHRLAEVSHPLNPSPAPFTLPALPWDSFLLSGRGELAIKKLTPKGKKAVSKKQTEAPWGRVHSADSSSPAPAGTRQPEPGTVSLGRGWSQDV